MCKDLQSLCPFMYIFWGFLISVFVFVICIHTNTKSPLRWDSALCPPLGQRAWSSERENVKEWKISSQCLSEILNDSLCVCLYLCEVTVAVCGDLCVWAQAGQCGLCDAEGSPGCSRPTAWRLCVSVGVCERARAAGGRLPPTTCCSSEQLQT